MTTDDAEGALLELASSLVDEVAAARLVLAGHGSSPPRELTRRQRDLADNHDCATPDRPGRPHCAYCGGTAGKLVPGPDKEFLGDKADHFCQDERACIARRERRYPPDPSKVPSALMDLARRQDEAEAARQPALPAPEPPGSQQEGWQEPQGWQVSQYFAWDVNGQWHPALPRFDAYAHTIAGGAHTGHLLSGQTGQNRPHYYAGPNYLPMAVYGSQEGAGGPQEGAGGPQEGSGGTPGSGGIAAGAGAPWAARGGSRQRGRS